MTRFWKRGSDRFDLEGELRKSRPEPRSSFVHSLSEHVRESRARPRVAGVRLAAAGVLTAALLVSLAGFGGIGYAASAVKQVAQATGIASAKGSDKDKKPDKDQYKEERKKCQEAVEQSRHDFDRQQAADRTAFEHRHPTAAQRKAFDAAQKNQRKSFEDNAQQAQKRCEKIGK
jgi:Skp family chaperone for outer membrane proteins